MKLKYLAIAMIIFTIVSWGTIEENVMSREIDEMEFARTMGFDILEDDMVKITMAGDNRSVSPSGEETSTPLVLINEGKTITDAVTHLQTFTDKYVFFGYVSQCIIGENAAKNGISRYLDYVERNVYMRFDTRLYMVQGESAEATISSVGDKTASIYDRLHSMEKDERFLYVPYSVTVREFISGSESRGAFYMPMVALKEKEKGDESSDINEGEEGSDEGKTMYAAGYALFKDYRLAGEISMDDAYGMNILLNEIRTKTEDVETSKGEAVGTTITWGSTKYVPKFEDGKFAGAKIEIELDATLNEHYSQKNFEEELESFEEQIRKKEQEKVERVLEYMQSLGADAAGIGRQLELAAPYRWENAQIDWESVFPEAEFEIDLKVELQRTFGVSKGLGEI